VAQTHGKQASETGYIYVKAPEILDKWVGNTEKEIRELFERGRRHFREHGYKAILAFDEADAIMPQRGTRRSSDVSDTIVPMFLGEMDGIDSRQTEENPIVILMTNRADVLDPAVTRPGRISRHIKVERPDQISSIDVLKIHAQGVPFSNDDERAAILVVAASDLFSKTRLLYRVNNQHDFTLGDCVNGAMLSNIVEIAKMIALHRDLENNTKSGVSLEDFRSAVQKVFRQQRGINHSFDLQDFAERLGIQPSNMQIERCFGAA
jgi:proteasome-associated ATPase